MYTRHLDNPVIAPALLLADEPTGNLDTKNAEAVMDLLCELHREGATIVMVTHDPRYAQYAARTVHLLDGRITNGEAPTMAVNSSITQALNR